MRIRIECHQKEDKFIKKAIQDKAEEISQKSFKGITVEIQAAP